MATRNLTVFETFAENLYRESPRAAWELESMKYGIMARIGLPEPDALEIVCRILATGSPTDAPKGISSPKSNQRLRGSIP